jgi:pyruvate/oxaloacetate carboxyltransferase
MNVSSQGPAAGDGDKHYGLVDVTLRDAHQCLWSTRMTTSAMTPILTRIDEVGYEYINILGGAVFDVQVRFLHENPWERVGLLCERLRTPCDGLTRGQSLYTFELFPDDIIELNSKVLARRGLKVLTVYDALNDNRNIESSVRSAHETGMLVNAMMTYTLSPVHTDDYYVERARELVALQSDFISVKDPTGLLTPERAKHFSRRCSQPRMEFRCNCTCTASQAWQRRSMKWPYRVAFAMDIPPQSLWRTGPPILQPKKSTIARVLWASPRVSIEAR